MNFPIRIVLVDASHPGNIGAVARAMKNMGLSELVLVRPRQYPDAEATVRASSAADLLARARIVPEIAEAVGDCGLVLGTSARPRAANWEVLEPPDAAARVVAAAEQRPVAILFGGERNGLSNEDLSACHALVTVPANPQYESLNLAQAVQILTWEIRKATGAKVRRLPAESAPATAEQMAHLRAHLAKVLAGLGFDEPRNHANLVARIERLLARAVPDEKEVQILRGVLTAVERSAGLDGNG
ncbi:MAG: methyltransferase [Proteobacteria bacterium]|nr:methyltransferase [Pseudomonadota bacterium]